jgi:hypothetical protein
LQPAQPSQQKPKPEDDENPFNLLYQFGQTVFHLDFFIAKFRTVNAILPVINQVDVNSPAFQFLLLLLQTQKEQLENLKKNNNDFWEIIIDLKQKNLLTLTFAEFVAERKINVAPKSKLKVASTSQPNVAPKSQVNVELKTNANEID